MTYTQFAFALKERCGRGPYHAASVYRAFFKTADLRVASLAEFAAAPAWAAQVQEALNAPSLPQMVSRASEGGTVKLVLQLADGLRIETVVIPMQGYTTLCVSSQVGCRMGCRFCRTGRMGLSRSLTADEIVAQVYYARVHLGHPVRNVVFMGMGEPLDNCGPLVQAIRILNDQRGLNIPLRRITVSTAGLVDGIQLIAQTFGPHLNLALSLNAVDDNLRGQIMPINRRWPLAALRSALQAYPLPKRGVIFIEYVLIGDVNDAPAQAHALADFLTDIPVRVNLIAYNPEEGSPWQAPAESHMRQFQAILAARHIFVRRRTLRGAAIRAACGQLGGPDFYGVVKP